MPMLAAVICVARRRRMHCRGSDTEAAAVLELERVELEHDPGDHRHRWRDEPAPVVMPGGREQTRRQGRRRLPRDGGPALGSRRQQQHMAVAAGAEQVPPPEEEVRGQPGPGSCATVVSKKAPVVAGDAREPSSAAASVSSSVLICAVCLEEVPPTDVEATTLPCSHSYHAACVLPWLAAHGGCPCCRATVPSLEDYI